MGFQSAAAQRAGAFWQRFCCRYVGVSQNEGYHSGGPHNKDYDILGSILGSGYFGKLPCQAQNSLCSASVKTVSGLSTHRPTLPF